jgi:hypothetical protein
MQIFVFIGYAISLPDGWRESRLGEHGEGVEKIGGSGLFLQFGTGVA